MTTAGPSFGSFLRGLREQAGSPSARDFYRANGGRAFFGCTYEQYVNVETGRSAPGPALAERAAVALRVWQVESRAKGYFTAYLRQVLRREELVKMIAAALSGPGPSLGSEASPLRQAFRRNLDERRRRLTEAEAQTIRSSEAAFWCFNVICCEDGPWAERELAKTIGLPVPVTRRALQKLSAAGVIARDKEGRFRPAAKGRIFAYPRRRPHLPDDFEKILGHYDRREKNGGETEMYESMLLRASGPALRRFFSYLAQSVQGAAVYASDEGEDKSLFLVEGRVRRLLPLPRR
ncbi:MAG: hypothetical protein AAB320_03305 [Elusimicrobiota bacterium]